MDKLFFSAIIGLIAGVIDLIFPGGWKEVL